MNSSIADDIHIVDNLSQLIAHEGVSDHKMVSFSMFVQGRFKQHKKNLF